MPGPALALAKPEACLALFHGLFDPFHISPSTRVDLD
jgi:hypothetical protein